VNKELYGNTYDIPENILNHLQKYSGEKTISNLIDSKKISYSNMKKIIHDMDKGELNELGGDVFKNWISRNLESNREGLKTSKNAKRKGGVENAFISPHEKNKQIRSTQRHRKSTERHDTSVDNSFIKLDESVVVELRKINDLIKKLL
jgi:hypothetical protein